MKLMIEIDDEHYATITNRVKAIRDEASKNGYANNDVVPIGWVSIADGTQLPKGHGDLKDADLYKAEVKKYITENKNSDDLFLAGCGDGAYHALHIYDCIPTIIEADGGENNEVSD